MAREKAQPRKRGLDADERLARLPLGEQPPHEPPPPYDQRLHEQQWPHDQRQRKDQEKPEGQHQPLTAEQQRRHAEQQLLAIEQQQQLLAALTPSMLEQCEVEAFGSLIADGTMLRVSFDGALPTHIDGLCHCNLDTTTFDSLTALHDLICNKLQGSLARWGGVGDDSGRLRGYGYLRGTLGESYFKSTKSLSMREYTGLEAAKDLEANTQASILLDADDLAVGTLETLDYLCNQLRPLVPQRYRPVLDREHLVAAQPNLHNGSRLLRPHLDEPLHDGFGVIIVTVAIKGSAEILLRAQPWDSVLRRDYFFPLQQGELYILSGSARNICLHGVLASPGGENRASLNLRFGLHSSEATAEYSAWNEVERHWVPANGAGP